ncbi:MAG TPA: acyltransferase [Gemmatimonadaceae bacterium]|nr:acyltransferase [Gemmatimonadaceae bacterium]
MTTKTALPERNLDVLRAVAVLLVLADHVFAANAHASGPWNWNWAVGRLGVLLFFVHTSLVLMSSLERGGSASGWVRRFYLRRAFRIYPLAIVIILLASALRLPPHVTSDGSDMARVFPPIGTLVSNLLLVQNLTGARDIQGVLWSLPLEVQMYVLLPLCFVLARRGTREMLAMVVVFVAVGLVLQSSLTERIPGLWRLSVFSFGPCFMGGVLAYHLLRRGARPTLPAWTWPLVIVAVAVGFAALQPDAKRLSLGWWPCLALGAMIPLVAQMSESLATRFAHQIAKYSYGIYLTHVPILWVWLRAIPNLPTTLRWIGVAASLVLVPMVLYRAIEHPMTNLGRRLAGDREVAINKESRLAEQTAAP